MDLFKQLLIFSSIVGTIICISVPTDQFHTLIVDRCFNQTYDRKPLTLGQNSPVGTSIENLISLIEKIEAKRPELTAQQMVLLILRRFHKDGLHLTGGVNMQSQIEMKHSTITEEIMQSSPSTFDFPEDALTEDEKCALFYTISHTVNETATYNEDVQHVYQKQLHLSRAPTRPDNKTVPAPQMVKKLNTSAPIQSEFLNTKNGDQNKSVPQLRTQPVQQKAAKSMETKEQSKQSSDSIDDNNKRFRRAQELTPKPQTALKRPQTSLVVPSTIRVTRRPRERGIASYRNDKTMAIAANRVLLGAAVGLLSPTPRSTRDLLKAIAPKVNTDRIPDGTIDPLLAVTLSDLLGIDAGSGLAIPAGDVLFGATGHWNSTACQTTYKLTSNGTLATLAELRGGLDGYNIGRKLPTIVQQNPKITLSQILRQYYSPRGLGADQSLSVCNRGYGVNGELQNKVKSEAENYIRVWNGVYYDGSYYDNQLTGFVGETWPTFYQFLNRAGSDKPSEERDYCNLLVGTDIKSAPCESSADVFFLLDNMPAQVPTGTSANEEEIAIVTQVVKSLNLGRYFGSTSVLVNAQGINPDIVDENNQQITTSLYALAYNTTSSQCASCRAAWFDNRQMSLTDRPLVMELVNKTLMEYKLKKADLPGVPSKNFIWFDYGNLKPIPTERDSKRKYDDFKWRLRYEQRDVTFFMATMDKDPIKDLLRRDEDWIQVGQGYDAALQKGTDLVNKMCQTPQTFQHNECRVSKSQDKIFEGFLTPGFKQYWAMYPEFFIKSYTIDLKFKAEKAKIKVCFDRYPVPEREDRFCDEAKSDGDELSWKVRNPCQGKTFESCPPFYFTISLSSQSGNQVPGNNCFDSRCKSADQIKWTFTHSGVSCNSTLSLLPNWTFQLICFVLFLTIFFTNGKRN